MLKGAQCAAELPSALPPLDAWKVNPCTLKKFYAPTDSRGFVKPEATIELILSLFDESYVWPASWSKSAPHILRPDDHHFHWVSAGYSEQLFQGKYAGIPAKFRDLPTNRGIIPRQFHNVIHKYTLPPKTPKQESMVRYFESFEIARQLFRNAERALLIYTLFDQTEEEAELERYVKRYDEIFADFSKTRYKALGERALQIIGEPDVDIESFSDIAKRLGSCALLAPPNYTEKYFAAA